MLPLVCQPVGYYQGYYCRLLLGLLGLSGLLGFDIKLFIAAKLLRFIATIFIAAKLLRLIATVFIAAKYCP
jgi:hypothetical protein